MRDRRVCFQPNSGGEQAEEGSLHPPHSVPIVSLRPTPLGVERWGTSAREQGQGQLVPISQPLLVKVPSPLGSEGAVLAPALAQESLFSGVHCQPVRQDGMMEAFPRQLCGPLFRLNPALWKGAGGQLPRTELVALCLLLDRVPAAMCLPSLA